VSVYVLVVAGKGILGTTCVSACEHPNLSSKKESRFPCLQNRSCG